MRKKYVLIEDMFDKLPVYAYTGTYELVEITSLRVDETSIGFFDNHGANAFLFPNCRELKTGERNAILLPHYAIERLHVRWYSECDLFLESNEFYDTRTLLKEEHGRIQKIIYTEEENQEFFEIRRRKRKERHIRDFTNLLVHVERELQDYSSYGAYMKKRPLVHSSLLGNLDRLAEFCTFLEYLEYEEKLLHLFSCEEKKQIADEAIQRLEQDLQDVIEEGNKKKKEAIQRRFTTYYRWLASCGEHERLSAYKTSHECIFQQYYFT